MNPAPSMYLSYTLTHITNRVINDEFNRGAGFIIE